MCVHEAVRGLSCSAGRSLLRVTRGVKTEESSIMHDAGSAQPQLQPAEEESIDALQYTREAHTTNGMRGPNPAPSS